MTMVRFHLLLALALGLLASGLNANSVFADEVHDHDAEKTEKKIAGSLSSLSATDRKLAEAQRFCPMMAYNRLGAHGTPIKLEVEGKPIFVCCKGCVSKAKKDSEGTLKTVQKLTKVSAVLAKLPAKERTATEAQKYCAIANKNFLGSMGAPVKLELKGKPVYLCCKGCASKAKANPDETLATVAKLKKAGATKGHDHKH